MTRRRLLWSAVAAVLALLTRLSAFESGLLSWPCPSGMKAKADAVRLGMTESEVDAVLAGPPAIKAPLDEQGCWRAVWYSREGNVAVDFSSEGRVAVVRFVELPVSGDR